MKRLRSLLPLLALLGCANTDGQISAPAFTEAGAHVDGGQFGNATMQNTLVMSETNRYAHDLSNRFAREVTTTVNFAFASDQLDAGARRILHQQAAWIRQFPEVRFRVYGHTDAVGPSDYNKNLGLRRAHAVVNYFASQGINRSRLEAVVSFGEMQPLIVTQGRERRNRRTVTDISGFVLSHPLIMDGKYAEVIQRETILSAKPASDLIMAKRSGTVAQ